MRRGMMRCTTHPFPRASHCRSPTRTDGLPGLYRIMSREALLIELRNMNNEVSGTQNDGDPIKDLENFRKQSAMVASALLYLRQRNTYNGNTTPTWLRPPENSGLPTGPPSSSSSPIFLNHDSGSHVMEVIGSSRRKARTMVDSAVKIMCSLSEGQDAFVKIGEALDRVNIRDPGTGSTMPTARYHPDLVRDNSAIQNHTTLSRFEPNTVHAARKPQISGDVNESDLPVELISSCVATLYMIQFDILRKQSCRLSQQFHLASN